MCIVHLFCPFSCTAATWTEVRMGRLEVAHSNCLRLIAGVKLTDRHRLETTRTMWHVIAGFDARSVAEDGRMEQLKLTPGHRNIKDFSGMYSSQLCDPGVP
eukprot:354078-Chlamydomonas_euryale.AAC.1